MTDGSGEIVFDQDYLPFGGDLPNGGELEVYDEIGERYKFTGQREEISIGLYYYGARYYDPFIGRFITEDTYPGELVNPQTFNLYVYCMNNPLIYVDPSGHTGILISGDPTGITFLFSFLYNNVEWKNSADNFMTQTYFEAKEYVKSSRKSQMILLGKIFAWQIKQISWKNERLRSLIPDIEIFPFDVPSKLCIEKFPGSKPGILEPKVESFPLEDRLNISNITPGFEPLPEWMKMPPVLGIPYQDRSLDDSIMMAERTGEANFANQQSLDLHYKRHVIKQNEYGNITKNQYLKKAQDLVNSNPSEDILTKIRSNEDVLYYNISTNDFAVKTSKNIIRTFFKPNDGIDYFKKQ